MNKTLGHLLQNRELIPYAPTRSSLAASSGPSCQQIADIITSIPVNYFCRLIKVSLFFNMVNIQINDQCMIDWLLNT